MKKKIKMEVKEDLSRRNFITKTAIASIGTIGAINILSSCSENKPARKEEKLPVIPEKAPEGKILKAGLIGCGGRGTGAAINFVDAGTGLEITALGDVFQERIDKCREELKNQRKVRSLKVLMPSRTIRMLWFSMQGQKKLGTTILLQAEGFSV